MRTENRGDFEEEKTKHDGVQLRAAKWHDIHSVSHLSTFTSANPKVCVQRWDKKRMEAMEVACPAILQTYNKSMEVVDLYTTKVRSRKW